VLESCIVGVQLSTSIVKALEVCISDKGDVYQNYYMMGLPEAHASYHSSGQQHIKKGGKYVEWDGGPTGNFEPMRVIRTRPGDVITRADCGGAVGWEVGKLGVLPILTKRPDMLVDARPLAQETLLAFICEVVGKWGRSRRSVSGFPILHTHVFGAVVKVEVHAFLISDDGSGAVSLEDF
jgi:hypothetical protein